MRIRTLLICSIFFLSNTLLSQNSSGNSAPFVSNSFDSFKTGEWIKFRIHYGFFNASYATLELQESTIKSENVFKAVAIGRTTGIARLFFKVEDRYETYFNKNLVRPLKSTRNIYEGGYTKNVEIKRDNYRRWLLVDKSPNEVWSLSKEFFRSYGFFFHF